MEMKPEVSINIESEPTANMKTPDKKKRPSNKKDMATTGVEPKKNQKRRKQKRKTIIIAVAAVAVAGVIAVSLLAKPASKAGGLTVSIADTTTLAYTDITNSISATGTVESNDSHFIYSTLSYPVQEIYVSVGDQVAEGDALCKLDSTDLEDQIESKELSNELSEASGAQSVKTARDSYNAAKDAIEDGTNSSLISAQSSVTSAYNSYVKAVKTYNDYVESLDYGYNSTLLTQDSAVETARAALESAQTSYSSAQAEADAAKAALEGYTPDTSSNDAAVAAAQTAYDGCVLDQQMKQTAYDTALMEYQTAQTNYNTTQDATTEAALTTAKTTYDTALAELEKATAATQAAQTTLESTKTQQSAGTDSAQQSLQADYQAKQTAADNAQSALDTAQKSYDSAVRSRNAAYANADNTLADYAASMETAYQSYLTALESYDAAVASAETSLQSSKNSLKSAELNANNDSNLLSLEQLYEDLEMTNIKSTAAGTVTAVYATVGKSGSGLLFVIEDVGDLVVETSVKEYDIDTVAVGQAVTIKSDALGGDTVYEGVVTSIAPTSAKDSQGVTDASSDVAFAATVKVTSPDTKLRIGMNVRLNYMIDQQESVLTVPYEAVYTNDAGKDCILALEKGSTEEKYLVREIPVTRGLENDLDIAVSGDGIMEGLQVITAAESYRHFIGMEVTTSSPTFIDIPAPRS